MLNKMRRSKLTVKVSKSFFLKLSLIFVSLFGVFFMTGMLYFRNDVVIIDGSEKRTVVTVHDDPVQILREQHIALGSYDRVKFSGFNGGALAQLEVERAFEVKVYVDGELFTSVYSIDSTVGELLDRFGVELGEYDSVSPSSDAVVKHYDSIHIRRAYDVNITADGETVTVPCLDNDIGELMERAGRPLGKYDTASIGLDKIITEPCDITVYRVEKTVSVSKKVTPFETVEKADNLTVIGDTRVITEGVDGIEETTVTVTYVDGVRTQTETVTKTLAKKTDKVIGIGAAVAEPYCKLDDPDVVLENGRPVNYEYIVSGKATAYTAPAGSYTASGRKAEIGTCAVNPNQIPYGSLVYIVGQDDDVVYGCAIAADTGLGMMDGTIPVDVYMGDSEAHYNDSCRWGLQMVDIYVVRVGED